MPYFGIDVSRYQGNFNMDQAAAEGVKFCIARIGGADDKKLHFYKDSTFDQNYNNCKRLGLSIGAYYLFNANTLQEAEAEAKHFLQLLGDKQLDYPIALDIEGYVVASTPKETLVQCIVRMGDILEKAGWFVVLYGCLSRMNSTFWDARLDRFDRWVACYSKNKPTLKGGREFGIWQFGGTTNYIRTNKVAGVVCDQDYSYRDYSTAIKASGLNNYKNPEPTPTPTPTPSKCQSCKYCQHIIDAAQNYTGKDGCVWRLDNGYQDIIDVTGGAGCDNWRSK